MVQIGLIATMTPIGAVVAIGSGTLLMNGMAGMIIRGPPSQGVGGTESKRDEKAVEVDPEKATSFPN